MIGIGVIGALFNVRLAQGLMERLTPDLVEKIEPEKLVDPLFRESLLTDLGPEIWSVAEPQVQAAVATAITDNFLLAAAIVFISVLAILRMKEIRLRGTDAMPSVGVERPDPGQNSGVDSQAQPMSQVQPMSNGATAAAAYYDSLVRALPMREQHQPESTYRAESVNGSQATSQRRAVIAAGAVGAGIGLLWSMLNRSDRS